MNVSIQVLAGWMKAFCRSEFCEDCKHFQQTERGVLNRCSIMNHFRMNKRLP